MTMCRNFLFSIAVFVLSFSQANASDGVFGQGPSDPSLFLDVINLPGDPEFGDELTFTVNGVQVNIFEGGTVSGSAGAGSEFNLLGGVISTTAFSALSGSEVNVIEGLVQNNFTVFGADVNVFGGIFQGTFGAVNGDVNLSGGVFQGSVFAGSGSDFNIFGSDFALDGLPITGLSLGETLEIIDRDSVLTGVFENGTSFSFDLGERNFLDDLVFNAFADVTITTVPEPNSLLLACCFGFVALSIRRR